MAGKRITTANFRLAESVVPEMEAYMSDILGNPFIANYRALLQLYFDDAENKSFAEHLRIMVVSILKQAAEHEKGKEVITIAENEITVKDKPFPKSIVELFKG